MSRSPTEPCRDGRAEEGDERERELLVDVWGSFLFYLPALSVPQPVRKTKVGVFSKAGCVCLKIILENILNLKLFPHGINSNFVRNNRITPVVDRSLVPFTSASVAAK